MIILGVDPGGTTGLAINIDGKYETWCQPDKRELFDFILSTPIEVIVIEQFITSIIHSHKYGIYTAEIVGAVEALSFVKKIPFHRRTNHQRLPFVSRATQIIKAKRRSYQDHEVAALAHLLGWERYNEIRARSVETETTTENERKTD